MTAKVVIDTRPLWLVALLRSRRLIAFAALVAATWTIVEWPTPAGLTAAGQRSLAVFFLCVALWVTQLLPLMITSLLAIILLPLLGVMGSRQAYGLFGSEAVFFILGAFIIAGALQEVGLSSRFSLAAIGRFGTSARTLLAGVMATGAAMSFIMPGHAVAALMFPVILELCRNLDLDRESSRFGKALFMAMAWGVIIGGVATFLGGARNVLAVTLLAESTQDGVSIGFFEWLWFVLPAVLSTLALGYFVILRFYPPEIDDVSRARDALAERVRKLGRASWREIAAGGVMVLSVIGWIVLGSSWGLANVAIAGVVLLFALRIVQWRQVSAHVNWGIVLMYGGAIALGEALNVSGAAKWMASLVPLSGGPMVLLGVLAIVSIILTEMISNAAVVALLMPVALGIGLDQMSELSLRGVTLAVAVPAGLAFCLPMGSPATAIAISSGFVRIKDLMLPGIIVKAGAIVLFALTALFWWPQAGLDPTANDVPAIIQGGP